MRTLLLLLTLSLTHPVPALNARITADTTAPKPGKHRKPLYEKGHGTLGFIIGLVFGPLGFAGVCLFSRNRTQRRKALQGILVCVFIATLALPFAIKGN
ncbi:MAG TPA: hypothetical protein VNW04_08565 [Puia sp.]|jgi:hypothetical protein|nr:hypothetical protein [Puia sp.]